MRSASSAPCATDWKTELRQEMHTLLASPRFTLDHKVAQRLSIIERYSEEHPRVQVRRLANAAWDAWFGVR